MKYNKSEIMRTAWAIRKNEKTSMSVALVKAWAIAKSGKRTLKVKEWIIDREQRTASAYNMFIDFERDSEGYRKVENGYLTVTVEETLAETAKAIRVRLATGSVVGSVKGWTLWIPKSQIAA